MAVLPFLFPVVFGLVTSDSPDSSVVATIVSAATRTGYGESTSTVFTDLTAGVHRDVYASADLTVGVTPDQSAINSTAVEADTVVGSVSGSAAERTAYGDALTDVNVDLSADSRHFSPWARATSAITADATAAVDRLVFADASLGVDAVIDSAVDRVTFGGFESSVEVGQNVDAHRFVDVQSDPINVVSGIEASAASADVSYEDLTVSVQLSASMDNQAVSHSELIVETATAQDVIVHYLGEVETLVGFLADQYLYHVANVDSHLDVTDGPFTSFFLGAKAASVLPVTSAFDSVAVNSASAAANPVEVAMAASGSARLLAVAQSLVAAAVSITASEINTAVARTSTAVAVGLGTVMRSSVATGATVGVVASFVTNMNSLLSANTATAVQLLETATMVKQKYIQYELGLLVDFLSLAGKPLFTFRVAAYDRNVAVLASARTTSVPFSTRTVLIPSLTPRTAVIDAVVKTVSTGLA